MKLAKYVKFREERFGGVLFETRSEKVFTLNPTATAIVREILAGGAESDVVSRLKENFNDRETKIEHEARTFISDLRRQGLVDD